MELWDVYDINRNRIEGRVSARGSDDMKDDEFHLVIFAVVRNSENKLLCGLRDRNKMFGGTWEFCGGSALSGETSRQAAQRELLEETGLDVTMCQGSIIFQNTKYWPGSNWFYDVWLFDCDYDLSALTPQAGEVEELSSFTFDEVKRLLDDDNFTGITGEFIGAIEEKIKK
ncbi:MAG: NUDIX hydrolase [Ruminococcaceae bacterium]|nr:NUDIX hydrolase [Oscillospiraceae bacterium]